MLILLPEKSTDNFKVSFVANRKLSVLITRKRNKDYGKRNKDYKGLGTARNDKGP